MKRIALFSLSLLIASATMSNSHAAEVVAFWGFADDYDFSGSATPNKFNFAADVDNTTSGNANLQGYLGVADQFDTNGGGGSISYTSPTSGITYGPTRTLKWNDSRGGGPDFDINGTTLFDVDDQAGTVTSRDFGNDALMYITFDATDFMDLAFRFDIEGTPGDLPTTFDLFYRVGGAGNWIRPESNNNIALSFQDYATPDPDNQFADSGSISLASAINNQSTVELIVSDFAEFGNGEMEIDNFEIIGTRISAIPEPSTVAVLAIGVVGYAIRRRRQRT